jgi:hypothetical protein
VGKKLTPQEVEQKYSIPVATLATRRSRPTADSLPYYKIGARVLYDEDEIEAFFRTNRRCK